MNHLIDMAYPPLRTTWNIQGWRADRYCLIIADTERMNLTTYHANIQERNADTMSETVETGATDVFVDKIQREADQLQRIQAKTFTKALNALKITSTPIQDIFHDLRDGKRLLDIVGHFLGLSLVCLSIFSCSK